MILKGNQRSGGRQMALHLLNAEQNEHVNVHQIRGFIADDILGALNEAYALSKGTQCKQYMYSLSLSPPQEAHVPVEVFEETLARIEKKLGLEGQPRVVVFHEKEGRRHAHCVWSRIDIDSMTAVNISHPKLKLNDIAKSLYLEHGWQMPEGFRNKAHQNPLNFTRAQWQQAARIGRNAQDIKQELQECWAISDNKKSFENALASSGYILAKGDKHGFVVIDTHGEIYSLSRQLGVNKKSLGERLGREETLPSVETAKECIAQRLAPLFKKFHDELNKHHQKQMQILLDKKLAMKDAHASTREHLKVFQDQRWQQETEKRAARVRHGFKGFWDKLSGRYWKIRKENEAESWGCHQRDQKQREDLIHQQLAVRQELQKQIIDLREQHDLERKALIRDLGKSHDKAISKKSETSANKNREQAPDFEIGHDLDFDI